MYCKSCGANMPEGTKFCTKCGAPAPQKTALGTIVERHVGEPEGTGSATGARGTGTYGTAGADAASQQAQAPAGVPQRPVQQEPPVQQSQPDAAAAGSGKEGKGGSALSFVSLGLAAVAMVLAILGFVLPQAGAPAGPKAVDAGIAKVTIEEGETVGKAKILAEKTPYVVVCTSVGGDATYGDVMFDSNSGEIRLIAKKKTDKDVERSVMWVAYEK